MNSRLRLLATALIVLLLLTSVTVPVAADSLPLLAGAAPATATLVVEGVKVVLASAIVIGIGNELSKHWDGVTGNFENFASDVGKAIDGLISRAKWVDATSNEGKALIQAETELFKAAAASGGKKPEEDKWYHEARRPFDKVEVNTERLTEEQAVTKVKDGKDIFTLNERLARDVAQKATREVAEAKGVPEGEIKTLLEKIVEKGPETHGGGRIGYYLHYHPKEIPCHRPHIWYNP